MMTETPLATVPESVRQIIFWCAVLAGLVFVLFGGLWYYRRRWLRSMDSHSGTPWTFDDLRIMKEQGQISEDEYRSLRAAMVAAYSAGKTEMPSSESLVEDGDVVWQEGDPEP